MGSGGQGSGRGRSLAAAAAATVLLLLPAVSTAQAPAAPPAAQGGPIYELRTYYTNPGKLETLKTRFRDHALRLFKRHGMTPVAFWVKQPPAPDGGEVLIYVLAFPSQAARDAAWKAFFADSEWRAAATASEANGKLLSKVESSIMTVTDFSPPLRTADAAAPP